MTNLDVLTTAFAALPRENLETLAGRLVAGERIFCGPGSHKYFAALKG